MTDARCNYHHGDLRNALIIAAAELIERDGTLEFSMAEAAAKAGVSAAAPYRHFADKDELILAVLDRGHFGYGAHLPKLCAKKTRILLVDVGRPWRYRRNSRERRRGPWRLYGFGELGGGVLRDP